VARDPDFPAIAAALDLLGWAEAADVLGIDKSRSVRRVTIVRATTC
jgi:hypothetical protein